MIGRLLCAIGVHSSRRSQGVVGYCLRPRCVNLKRVHDNGRIWVRYVEPPPARSGPSPFPRQDPPESS